MSVKNLIQKIKQKFSQVESELNFHAQTTLYLSLSIFAIATIVIPIRYYISPMSWYHMSQILISYLALILSAVTTYIWPRRSIGAHLLIIALYLMIVPPALTKGGLDAPIYIFITVVPLLAAILIGLFPTIFYFTLCIVSNYVIYKAVLDGHILGTFNENEYATQTIRLLMYSTLVLVTAVIGLLYERQRFKNAVEIQKKALLEKRLSEAEGIKSIVVTYQHHINSPLMVAQYYAEKLYRQASDVNSDSLDPNIKKFYERLHQSLKNIEQIVKEIDNIADKDVIEQEKYSGGEKMYKIK